MKRSIPLVTLAFCVAALCSRPLYAGCRPAREWIDSITKQQNVKFEHNLNQIGFWKSMVVTDIELWVMVLRFGQVNAVNVQLTKVENDRDRAAYDSQFRGAKGDRFTFGFKGGEPLTFVAAEVSNNSKIVEGKGLVMTTILSAHVSDSDMAQLREVFTTKMIDAVRVHLTTGQIDRVVDEEHGEAMLEKFTCFYSWLEKRGIELSSASQVAAGAATTPAEASRPKLDLVVEDILAQDKLTLQAILNHDMSYLDKHIHDDAIFSSQGRQLTKRMLLAQTLEQQKPPGPVRSRHANVTSKTTGDVVEVTATTTLSVQVGGSWRDFLEVRGTTKYRKVDGEWIILEGRNEYEKAIR